MASTPLSTVFRRKETCALRQATSTRSRSSGLSSTNSSVFIIAVGVLGPISRGLEFEPKATAFPRRGIGAHRAVQAFGRFLDDGQAHARTRGIGRIRKTDERLEHPVDLLRWNPEAVVLHP